MKPTFLALGALLCVLGTAQAASGTMGFEAQRARLSVPLADQTRQLARELARSSPAWRSGLASRLAAEQGAVELQTLLKAQPQTAALAAQAARADREIRRRKGLERHAERLLELRLADPAMLAALKGGAEPLVAYEPDGDERDWQAIEAFDAQGGVHLLDVHARPQRPVLVVDLNARKDMAAGLKLMRERLAGLSGRAMPELAAASAGTPVSLLDKVRLSDDEEPWISGNAEVYAVVTGVDPSRDQPALDIVDLPYLDHDGRDYYPNQTLILWDRYRWGAADVILMEHDDNTNYQQLVSYLFNVASQILSAVGYPEIGVLVGLGSGLVERMPSHWFSNDDDYVDSYYTLEKGHYYTNHPGARGNALISLRPYVLGGN